MKILKFFDILIGLINEFIAAFGISAGVFLAFINVIARFVFHEGIEWAFELTNYLFIWSAFFGAAYGFKKEIHIKVTLLIDILPVALAKYTIIISKLITFFYLLTVSYFGYLFIFDPDFGVKASGEISINLNIPMWIPYLALPLAFLSAALRVLQKTVELIKTPSDEIKQVGEHEMIIEETKLNLGENI